MKCGRELGGRRASKHGVCPVSTCVEADGFCDGVNGGRGCIYVSKIYDLECNAARRLSLTDVLFDKKTCRCENCDFYKALKDEHGKEVSEMELRKHMAKGKKKFIF